MALLDYELQEGQAESNNEENNLHSPLHQMKVGFGCTFRSLDGTSLVCTNLVLLRSNSSAAGEEVMLKACVFIFHLSG